MVFIFINETVIYFHLFIPILNTYTRKQIHRTMFPTAQTRVEACCNVRNRSRELLPDCLECNLMESSLFKS